MGNDYFLHNDAPKQKKNLSAARLLPLSDFPPFRYFAEMSSIVSESHSINLIIRNCKELRRLNIITSIYLSIYVTLAVLPEADRK